MRELFVGSWARRWSWSDNNVPAGIERTPPAMLSVSSSCARMEYNHQPHTKPRRIHCEITCGWPINLVLFLCRVLHHLNLPHSTESEKRDTLIRFINHSAGWLYGQPNLLLDGHLRRILNTPLKRLYIIFRLPSPPSWDKIQWHLSQLKPHPSFLFFLQLEKVALKEIDKFVVCYHPSVVAEMREE